jgi:RNase P protein component
VRRQLRELARASTASDSLAPGAYLVIVDPEAARHDFATVRGHWDRAVAGLPRAERRND